MTRSHQPIEEPGAEEPGAEEPGAEEPGAEEPGAEDSPQTGSRGRRISRGKDARIIAALASGATHIEAGQAAHVSERTVRRRLESPPFQRRLREEEDRLNEEDRRLRKEEAASRSQVRKLLIASALGAATRITGLSTSLDVTDQVALRASEMVLRDALYWSDATDLEDRLRDLEIQLAKLRREEPQ